jgi:hypothetical protein
MNIGSEVLAVVATNNYIFGDLTLCSLVKSQLTSQKSILPPAAACCLFHAGFLISLLFNSEDGGDMIVQNIS